MAVGAATWRLESLTICGSARPPPALTSPPSTERESASVPWRGCGGQP